MSAYMGGAVYGRISIPSGDPSPNTHPGAAPAVCFNRWHHPCLRTGGAHKERVTPLFFLPAILKRHINSCANFLSVIKKWNAYAVFLTGNP
jgi:hypothetical protein